MVRILTSSKKTGHKSGTEQTRIALKITNKDGGLFIQQAPGAGFTVSPATAASIIYTKSSMRGKNEGQV